MEYLVHKNGGRPYKVKVNGNKVDVFKEREDEEDVYQTYYTKPIFKWTVDKVFVPFSHKNPTTSFGGGYGKNFHGNSLLIQIGKKYILIGASEEIISFEPKYPIVAFFSPVGNNDVPYPYAIDESGYTYVFLEKVRIYIEPYDIVYNRGELREEPTKFVTKVIYPKETKVSTKRNSTTKKRSPIAKRK